MHVIVVKNATTYAKRSNQWAGLHGLLTKSLDVYLVSMFLRFVRGYRNQLIPLRRYTNDITGASPKPFSEIPSPSGALPVLDHYFKTRNGLSKNVEKMFEEINGPIFKIKVFGMSLSNYRHSP